MVEVASCAQAESLTDRDVQGLRLGQRLADQSIRSMPLLSSSVSMMIIPGFEYQMSIWKTSMDTTARN